MGNDRRVAFGPGAARRSSPWVGYNKARAFRAWLRRVAPALFGWRASPVAPVDLAQAVIGPGMAIFSRYTAVLEADGSPMTVHTALTLINRMLTEGSDEFDADTQFCLGWFDEQSWAAGEFGKATVLARAKGTSVDRLREAGVVEASNIHRIGRQRTITTRQSGRLCIK
jgi:adenine-specific DNA methylase